MSDISKSNKELLDSVAKELNKEIKEKLSRGEIVTMSYVQRRACELLGLDKKPNSDISFGIKFNNPKIINDIY